MRGDIEACLGRLSKANLRIRKKMARSSVLLHADEVLAYSESIEVQLSQCVDGVRRLHETLMTGLD